MLAFVKAQHSKTQQQESKQLDLKKKHEPKTSMDAYQSAYINNRCIKRYSTSHAIRDTQI